ncbi:hypothetical protein N2599_25600 (plasmid) [Rhizobium sullae]|uniref:Uncharacterized protein n=1 Tax=Rhizobium sullae TaxID=50338 RepID=A0ABY5XVF0_RHISU|nr:hypothetical protein [Rhizobium sullae]UWU18599.1 hypothetical protein N2599_25600 [Rhizobium sullae]
MKLLTEPASPRFTILSILFNDFILSFYYNAKMLSDMNFPWAQNALYGVNLAMLGTALASFRAINDKDADAERSFFMVARLIVNHV